MRKIIAGLAVGAVIAFLSLHLVQAQTPTIPPQFRGEGFVTTHFVNATRSLSPGTVNGGVRGTVTFDVPGLSIGDLFVAYPPSDLEAGLAFGGAFIVANNTAVAYVTNITGSPIVGGTKTWQFSWLDGTNS